MKQVSEELYDAKLETLLRADREYVDLVNKYEKLTAPHAAVRKKHVEHDDAFRMCVAALNTRNTMTKKAAADPTRKNIKAMKMAEAELFAAGNLLSKIEREIDELVVTLHTEAEVSSIWDKMMEAQSILHACQDEMGDTYALAVADAVAEEEAVVAHKKSLDLRLLGKGFFLVKVADFISRLFKDEP